MILIIGGAGYIGSHFAKIIERPHVVFDNLSTGHLQFVKWGDFFNGDIRNPVSLDAVFQKYKITHVVHFGAFIEVGESVTNPRKYYENNLVGTINVLNAMVKYGVKSIVYSSTCATYGIPDICPINESTTQDPINPYGRSKRMTEEIIRDYHSAYGINYAILRYFNASGNDFQCEVGELHEPESHLIPNAIKALVENNPLKVFGNDYDTPDGTCIRDYIHVLDLAKAHVNALDYMDKENKSIICNLGTGRGVSVFEIIKALEEESGRKVLYEINERRPGDSTMLVANYDLAKICLGWEPVYGIRDIVRSALMWFGVIAKV